MRYLILLLIILLAMISACTTPVHMADIIESHEAGKGTASQGNDRAAAGRTKLRVMTFNIHWQGYDLNGVFHNSGFAHRMPLVLDVLTMLDADIIGLQEASVEQRTALAPGVREYGMFPLPFEPGDECILYKLHRFDLLESGHVDLHSKPEIIGTNIGARDFVWVYLQDRINGNRFYVVNLHLDHRSSERGRQLDGVLIGEWIGNREFAAPVILIGDFNGKPDQPRYLYLTGKRSYPGMDGASVRMPMPMLDTFTAANPIAWYTGTTNSDYKGIKSRNQIDYIFIPSGSSVIDSRIIYYHADGYYPSDHFPLLSEFELE
jgi:endonuclease/exonuclease/phosphatase family metal-dependent hydrolase